MSGVTEVRVTRSRDVLEGQVLPVRAGCGGTAAWSCWWCSPMAPAG